MTTMEQITLSELQATFNTLHLAPDTRMTVIIEENKETAKMRARAKALTAMKRLKGSGNGNLVSALLRNREKEALQLGPGQK